MVPWSVEKVHRVNDMFEFPANRIIGHCVGHAQRKDQIPHTADGEFGMRKCDQRHIIVSVSESGSESDESLQDTDEIKLTVQWGVLRVEEAQFFRNGVIV